MKSLRLPLGVSVLLAMLVLCAASTVHAEPADAHLQPQDVPYPGLLTIDINLSQAPRRIFQVRETIPVEPGPVTLYYPKWVPGEHAPTGPVSRVTGLVIKADGETLDWHRDSLDMYAFHVEVPEGAGQINLTFQFLVPDRNRGFGSWVSTTPHLAALEFNQVAFYPAGYYVRDIRIQPTVELPDGWRFATALDVVSQQADTIHFAPVSFSDLVDSPLIAGEYFQHVDLAPGADVPVALNVVGDAPEDIRPSEEQVRQLRNLVKQAYALFGSHHYDHYDFLLALSDHIGHFGLEHHQSSDNRLMADFFNDPRTFTRVANVLPHEFVHSWNGKFRRPAGLWTPTYNMPKRDDLLWVYEGLTSYWAGVLTTRSGMWTPEQYRQSLAVAAAKMAHRTGRKWRSLQDTATAMPLFSGGGHSWTNWRRGIDFMPEGRLLWLDVDTKIRQLSDNKRSLDDFAKRFFGMYSGSYAVNTYTFEDVVAALDEIQPFDWAAFLHARLDYTGTALPEHGIARSGWKLVYTRTPSDFQKATSRLRHGAVDLAASVGFAVTSGGHVYDVQWGGPAFNAGLVPGMAVTAVNGKDYSTSILKEAVRDARHARGPITLLVRNDDAYRTLEIDYHGGLRYPHLVRIKDSTNYLDDILAPRK
ncbi:MAG TPA: M61 family peptidase [Oleiagrimonas sp.]|nr:M61 family peptidase [Oleiagrimonas sp.]